MPTIRSTTNDELGLKSQQARDLTVPGPAREQVKKVNVTRGVSMRLRPDGPSTNHRVATTATRR
jgi:hypothetical protein